MGRLRREREEQLRKEEEEERLRNEEEERLRAEEEERLRKEEEEKARKEEEERLAKAAALREIQERLERQKAAAEARRLAAKEGDDHFESVELLEFRRAQEEMRRACEEAVISLESQKGKEAHQATWLAFVLASLALYWALRVFQEHIEREHRDELDVELQIAPYCYSEIKKWP